MKLVVINGNGNGDYEVSAHAANCKNLKAASVGRDCTPADSETRREVWLDYNGDLLAEGHGAWPIHFHPCTDELTDGGTYNTTFDR